jgi:hypothetical protein
MKEREPKLKINEISREDYFVRVLDARRLWLSEADKALDMYRQAQEGMADIERSINEVLIAEDANITVKFYEREDNTMFVRFLDKKGIGFNLER